MAQESPGHNASLHPLISAERTESRRKKGENRGVERAKKEEEEEEESGESDRKICTESLKKYQTRQGKEIRG